MVLGLARGNSVAAIRALAMRTELVEAAHVLSCLGLVTAYGHVSARATTSMLITPAKDLADVSESEIVEVPFDCSSLPMDAPPESWVHIAVYRRRPDAHSIARAQPTSALAAGAINVALVPLHGQAAWLGESVPVHDSAHLLRSADLAEGAAAALRSGEALLLRGNGAITIGSTPGIAAARMWLLSATCEVWLAARSAGEVSVLTAEEIASWREVSDELLLRLWHHLHRRCSNKWWSGQQGPSGGRR